MRVLVAPCSYQHVWLFCFDFSISGVHVVVALTVLICISLTTTDTLKDISMCLLATCVSSFVECLVHVSCTLKEIGLSFCWEVGIVYMYPGYQSFVRFMFCKYFLSVHGFPICFHECVLIYWMFRILMKYNSSSFYGHCYYLCPLLLLICLPLVKLFSFRTWIILAFTFRTGVDLNFLKHLSSL